MIINVISLVALLVTETYSQGFSHGHSQSNSRAYSTQSITMHQNHQEPVYYHNPDPYNDEYEENDHYIHKNHQLPDHRHLYREQSYNDHRNNYPKHQKYYGPGNLNVYNGQPIVVASGYKGRPSKDHQDYEQMSHKHQDMPLHEQEPPLRPHYNVPRHPFGHHDMPVHHNPRIPIRIDSHKHRPHHVNHIPNREYEFNYNIEDKLTGDHKAHHETRNDGVVKGVYSFQEADGSVRIVEYTADAKNGFHAKVRHEGQKHKVPKHHKNYSHHPRYHPQHNSLHPLLFNSPKY